jgi:hypothetical protein
MNLNHLNKIVDQLVNETGIDYEKNAVYNSTLFVSPSHPYFLTKKSPLAIFSQHCRDIYGLTEPEIEYVWISYKSIMIDKIENVEREPLNESYFDNINNPQQHKFFNRIADDLMDSIEEIINIQHDDEPLELLLNMGNVDHPHEGFYLHTPGVPVSGTDDFTYELFKKIMDNYTMDILNTIQNKWGLNRMDGLFIIIYFFLPKLWNKYYKQDKPSQSLIYSPSPLNESTGDNYLDKVTNQLVNETHVFNDRGQLRANPPFFQSEWEDVEVEGRATGVVGGFPLSELISSVESKEFDYSLAFMDFKYYCKQMYGLTWEECHEVWDKYREALYNTDFSHLYTPNVNLNESTGDNYLDKVVNQLVDETIIDVVQSTLSAPTDTAPFALSSYHNILFIKIPLATFSSHCEKIYGLTDEEIQYVWSIYRNIIKDKIENELIK